MKMFGGNSADEEMNENTTKLLSEIRSIVRLHTSLSRTFQANDAGVDSVKTCNAERDLLKDRLEIFISEMAVDCEKDRHIARRCQSIVNTVSGICYPSSARNVDIGKHQSAQPTTGRGSLIVERTRDTHAVVGRRAALRKAAVTEGKSSGAIGRRQTEVHEEKFPGRGRRPEGNDETRTVSGPRPLAIRGQGVYRAVRVSTVVVDHDDMEISTSGKMLEKSKTGISKNADTTILCNNSKVLKSGMGDIISRIVDEKKVSISTSDINNGASTKPLPEDLAKPSKEKPVQNYNRFRTTNMVTGNQAAIGKFNLFIKTTKPWHS